MTDYVDAAELLADARRKQERAEAVARRARTKLGVETAIHPGVYRAKSGPLAWLFDGMDPDDVIRDSRMLKKILRIFKSNARLRRSSTGRCNINLPSGKTVRFDPETGDVSPS